MADYAIRNLRDDVEDSAPKFGLAPALEAHFARKDLGAERIGLSLQRLAPNERSPFAHRHPEAEEVYVVIAGGGRVNVGGEVHDVRPWDAIRVAPQVVRSFESGPEGLELLAFGETGDQAEMLPVAEDS